MPDKYQKPKVYVIGKFEQKEEVKEVYGKLEQLGYEISYDWTNHKPIKPYAENQPLAEVYSENELRAISMSDIVICLSTKEGTTSKLETGAALILSFLRDKPSTVYVVGEFNAASPWFMHPKVTRKDVMDEVYAELTH
jgi:hypothetical protein